MRRIAIAAVVVWIGRWAAMEIASYASRHWVAAVRPATTRLPGHMPGPYD